jgi:hypothetical protein
MDMSAVSAFVTANQGLVFGCLGTLVVLLFIYYNRRRLAYILQEIDYHLPLIGRTARLMRRRNHHPDSNGWFPAETKVCADYYRFYRRHNPNRALFERCRAYLEKVGELHRRPKPFYLWLLIVVMIFAEAYGFTYVLAMTPWAFAQARLRDVPLLAGAIALLLAIVVVLLTDKAGRELHLNHMARRVRRDFAQNPGARNTALQPTTHQVRLEEPQDRDDNEPISIQALNRLQRRPNEISHLVPLLALVVILAIAALSTYVRYKAFERDQIDQQQVFEQERRISDARVTAGANLPQALRAQSQAADEKAQKDRAATDIEGAWSTFIMLAFIFVVLQIVATLTGYSFGFAGKESERAWWITHSFDSPEDYVIYHLNRRSEIANQAQVRLSDLQGRILRWVHHHPTNSEQLKQANAAGTRTFTGYAQTIAPVFLQSLDAAHQFQNSPTPVA